MSRDFLKKYKIKNKDIIKLKWNIEEGLFFLKIKGYKKSGILKDKKAYLFKKSLIVKNTRIIIKIINKKRKK